MAGLPLAVALAGRKSEIVGKWFDLTAKTYPASAKFLSEEKDPFRNPAGCAVKEGLSVLFEGLIHAEGSAPMASALGDIIRIRAVQDFTAGQAVSFVFLLKRIVRAEFAADMARIAEEIKAFEDKIDELALLAFDLFMKCREQMYEIRLNERKRAELFLERAQNKAAAH